MKLKKNADNRGEHRAKIKRIEENPRNIMDKFIKETFLQSGTMSFYQKIQTGMQQRLASLGCYKLNKILFGVDHLEKGASETENQYKAR